jgi:hypothetical protein
MKIGIVVDNYKKEKFEKALKEKQYVFTSSPSFTGCYQFIVLTNDFDGVRKLCTELEINIKRSN